MHDFFHKKNLYTQSVFNVAIDVIVMSILSHIIKACGYFAKLTSATDNIPVNITFNFDICMDCYETIIGPMTHNTYKHNPLIDNIAHDIVVKGLANYFTVHI